MKPASLKVIPSNSGGGSSYGLSFYFSFLGCRRQQLLDKEHGSGDAAGIGTLFHLLKEHYYRGELEDGVVLEYQEGPEDFRWQEALRMFEAYRARYPHDEFTKVVGVEVDLGYGSDDENSVAAREACLERYGVPVITGRADMVIYVDEECAAKHAETGLPLTEGYYILDTKTKKSLRRDMAFKFQHSFQAILYQDLWNLMNPDSPVQGMIFDVAARHVNLKDSSFLRILVPPPVPDDLRMLKNLLARAEECRLQFGPDAVNPLECFRFGACRHLMSGACQRI